MEDNEMEELNLDEMPAVKKMRSIYQTAQRRNSFNMSAEEQKALLDACDHSKSSYAEEMTLNALNDFIERYEADKKEQAKESKKGV